MGQWSARLVFHVPVGAGGAQLTIDYLVDAFYLGSTRGQAGMSGGRAAGVQVTLTDRDADGILRSGDPDHLVDGDPIIEMKSASVLGLISGQHVAGWYFEQASRGGDNEVFFLPTDGTIPVDTQLSENVMRQGQDFGAVAELDIVPPVPCFVSGTQIMTKRGERAVEELRVGDKVITRDDGLQPILWIGTRHYTREELSFDERIRPVRLAAGCLDHDRPERDLFVSRSHRLLLTDPGLRDYVSQAEALVPAKNIMHRAGVDDVRPNSVTYHHLLFERHQLILSEGLWTESFHPGQFALQSYSHRQQRELLEIFPNFASPAGKDRRYPLSRPVLKAREVRTLMP